MLTYTVFILVFSRIWASSVAGIGLAHIVLGYIRDLSRVIIEGGLDVYILQPKDVWINILSSRTIVSAWGDFAYGFIILSLLPGNSLLTWLLFLLLVVPPALIFAAIFSVAESLCFFMGNSSSVSLVLSEFLLTFSLYPEGIHSQTFRIILYTVVPSAFVAFMPLKIFRALNWPLVPVLWLIALAYTALSYGLFRLGLKRYESGNRMDARI